MPEILLTSPLLGLAITIVAYRIGEYISERFNLTLLPPLLTSCVLIILAISYTGLFTYEQYQIGGDIINFLLGPATVALALPLVHNWAILKKHYAILLGGVFVGTCSGIISVIFLAKLFGASDQIALSLVPKSVTTAIAMGISENIGGIPALTAACVIFTGIFGAMFGDVGQGLCLFIGGGLLYKIKKWNLAGIISVAGIFSTFFGFMFGSFFGFEGTIIKPMWLSPMHAMMKLPFVGQLNTVFIVAVAFGMALILLAMVFQIINAKKRGDKENLFFSPNGVAGLVFYGFLVLTIVLYMTGHKTPGNIMMIIFLGIPVIMFLLKEPLGQLVEGKKPKAEGGVGMFLVQGFFELFETMLSFFSNTISFVRIGAFAVSHAAMMEVVLMLGGITDGAGNPNWIIIVLGNIIVCGLEGLVVGIQVLRLEYYEMFSRFYTGSGREFHPYDNHAGKEN